MRDKKQWRQRQGAQPVSDLVSKLLDPVIERRAGMTMDLIASWEDIAGREHAAQSRPEKLRWPRQIGDDDPFEPATLIVACEGGHALFLQHDSASIIGRINTYFGFAAVAQLKLVQKPVVRREERTKIKRAALSQTAEQDIDARLADVSDPDLKAALKKMARGVFSKRSGEIG